MKENQLLKQQLSSTKMRLIEAESSSRKLDSRENGTRQLKSSISKLQNSVKAREASRGKGGSGGDRDFAGLQREPLQKKRVGSQVKHSHGTHIILANAVKCSYEWGAG